MATDARTYTLIMKETIVAMVIAFVVGNGSAGGVMKYYADHTYVGMSDYLKGNVNNRVWTLQDRINDIKDRAAHERRELTPYEQSQIRRYESEIRRLK